MTRRSLLFSMAAASVFAKEWDDSKFPDWSTATIDRLLTDSPWAKEWEATIDVPVEKNITSTFIQLGMDLPRLPQAPAGSRGPQSPGSRIPQIPTDGPWSVRTPVSLILRWASALPVRRASALQQFGRNGLGDERAVELLAGNPNECVLEIAGLPRNAAGKGPDEIQKQLMRTARVYVAGRRAVTPIAVKTPSYGALITASVRFPRYQNLNAEDGNLEVSFELGAVRVSERFRLRSMIYEGLLEV